MTPAVRRRRRTAAPTAPPSLRKEVDRQHPRSRDVRVLVDSLEVLLDDDDGFYPHKHQEGAPFARGMKVETWRLLLSVIWRLNWGPRTLHPALQELVDAVVNLDIEKCGFEFSWEDEIGPYLWLETDQKKWERVRAAWLRLRQQT